MKLFQTTIHPACQSVDYRFRGKDKMAEMIKYHEDLKIDLDENRLKWLTVIKFCKTEIEQANFLEKKVLSILTEEQNLTKNFLKRKKLRKNVCRQ